MKIPGGPHRPPGKQQEIKMFNLLLWPFIACVVLTGIHAYLGMHVIKRGVIFVDLALAQTAALGTLAGFAAGVTMHSGSSYLISLGFAIAGALFFAWARPLEKIVPQEAVIGITYVFAAAASVLILSRAPSEAEHIKDMLVGNILFVKPGEVIKTAVLYGGIGAFHVIFRKKFWIVADDSSEASKEKINVPLWDFLFYASFGAVVTSSVGIAGVLLVFSYLIIPAICSSMLAKTLKNRLLISWGIGIACSLGGMALSVYMDLPTGASIVAVFGVTFALFLAGKSIAVKIKRG
jgi:zinc/manganese transport system permease protein